MYICEHEDKAFVLSKQLPRVLEPDLSFIMILLIQLLRNSHFEGHPHLQKGYFQISFVVPFTSSYLYATISLNIGLTI